MTSYILNTNSATSFRLFSSLPAEIQQRIWTHAFPPSRCIPLDIFQCQMPRRSVFAPSSYHVDKASREFTLKHYKVLWEWVDWSFYPFSAFVEPMFLNPRRDVLSLDFNTLVRSDYPEYSAAHERVLFLLYNNPKPEIIHAVEILELSGVGTGELEIKDIAVDALGILEHFGGLKELRLLDIPHLADPSALGTTSWMFRKVVLRLVFCYAVLKVRGVRDRLPKMVVGGKEVVVEEDYEGCLSALEDGRELEGKNGGKWTSAELEDRD